MSSRVKRKQAEDVPEWIWEYCANLLDVTGEDWKKFEKWFSEAETDLVVEAIKGANLITVHEIAAKNLSVRALNEIETVYPFSGWSGSFSRGLAMNPNIGKVPSIWQIVVREVKAKSALRILEWIDLSEGEGFVDVIMGELEEPEYYLYDLLEKRPAIMTILNKKAVQALLASEQKEHRTAALLALENVNLDGAFKDLSANSEESVDTRVVKDENKGVSRKPAVIPDWVESLGKDSFDATEEEMQRLACWLARDENKDAVIAAFVVSRDKYFQEVFGAEVPAGTLEELPEMDRWTPKTKARLLRGLTRNPESIKVPHLWKYIRKNAKVSDAMEILKWVPLSDAREFADLILFRGIHDYLLSEAIEERPELINLLSQKELNKLLKAPDPEDRQRIIFALSALRQAPVQDRAETRQKESRGH